VKSNSIRNTKVRELRHKKRRSEKALSEFSSGFGKNQATKSGYPHADHGSRGMNVTRAVTRTRRVLGRRARLTGALGRAPGKMPYTAVYKKDERLRRRNESERQS
jgi:hypothetical protein